LPLHVIPAVQGSADLKRDLYPQSDEWPSTAEITIRALAFVLAGMIAMASTAALA
jgi:hypothetical protein